MGRSVTGVHRRGSALAGSAAPCANPPPRGAQAGWSCGGALGRRASVPRCHPAGLRVRVLHRGLAARRREPVRGGGEGPSALRRARGRGRGRQGRSGRRGASPPLGVLRGSWWVAGRASAGGGASWVGGAVRESARGWLTAQGLPAAAAHRGTPQGRPMLILRLTPSAPGVCVRGPGTGPENRLPRRGVFGGVGSRPGHVAPVGWRDGTVPEAALSLRLRRGAGGERGSALPRRTRNRWGAAACRSPAGTSRERGPGRRAPWRCRRRGCWRATRREASFW